MSLSLPSAIAMLLLIVSGRAQGVEDAPRKPAALPVCVVTSSDAGPYQVAGAALLRRLEKLGLRSTSFDASHLEPGKLEVLLGTGSCAFVAIGSLAATALAAKLPTGMPLVYCMVADPAAAGLPGRPRTFGVETAVPLDEQFRLLREALPDCRRVGMLCGAGDQDQRMSPAAVRRALPKGMELVEVVTTAEDSPAQAIERLLALDVDAIWTQPDGRIYTAATARTLLLQSLRSTIPVFGFSTAFVKAGAVIGVGIEPNAQGEQTAELVASLLAPPAPGVEAIVPAASTPPRYSIAINLIVAEKLGVRVASTLMNRADLIIRPK